MLTATKTRILLADNHPALLAETARLLAQDIEVVGTVADGLELLGASRSGFDRAGHLLAWA